VGIAVSIVSRTQPGVLVPGDAGWRPNTGVGTTLVAAGLASTVGVPWRSGMAASSWRVSKGEVQALTGSEGAMEDHELEKLLSGSKCYALADGSALVVTPMGDGRVYAVREKMVSYLRKSEEIEDKHVLFGRPSGQKGFIMDVDMWADRLHEILQVEPNVLDGSLASLANIDRALARWRRRPKDWLDAVIAYAGKVAVTAGQNG
jgi:hypothetical protein